MEVVYSSPFFKDGCTDDDECTLNIHHCDPMATCKNTNGSYDCVCNEGFTGDGYDCTDINECLTNNGGCSANARYRWIILWTLQI